MVQNHECKDQGVEQQQVPIKERIALLEQRNKEHEENINRLTIVLCELKSNFSNHSHNSAGYPVVPVN